MIKNLSISNIRYRCPRYIKNTYKRNSIDVIGIDTEAYDNGECFLICTSNWHIWTMEEFPHCLFSREYRGKNFVAYNLKYDEGALIQFLPLDNLRELREEGVTKWTDYIVSLIPRKCLSIRKGKNTATFYDMYNFYTGSLDYNAKKYLGEQKNEIETKSFSKAYVESHYATICAYCIQDAILVQKLGKLLIRKFEDFGVYPRKLYSTAYISYQYFRQNCNYVTVQRFWEEDKKLLDFSLKAYNGGKFEVTEKGCGYYYEYDIVSAYPYEIANLIDIKNARIVWSKQYRRYAKYGFIHVRMKIPSTTYSPVAIQTQNVNIYPVGEVEKVITKTEYDYLVSYGVDITIIDAVWLHIDSVTFPYRDEIEKLTALKHQFKREHNDLDYHTIKIIMNSLYGKFCQLIEKDTYIQASACWNPIYAAVITANVRTRVTELQQIHPEIIAVHTDSVISTNEIDFGQPDELGNMIYELEGEGVIIGSGLYQIGDKNKTRGFHLDNDLLQKIDTASKYIRIEDIKANTWREVVFHNWNIDRINRFETVTKKIAVDFDHKRYWINDYTKFSDMAKRKVKSLPRVATRYGV
jgi:hypothetical protein